MIAAIPASAPPFAVTINMTTIKKAVLQVDMPNIPSDDKLTGLSLLLDLPQVKRVLENNLKELSTEITECRYVYVRYKPATNCIVAYTAKYVLRGTGQAQALMFYGKCYAQKDFVLAFDKVNTHEWEEDSILKPVISLPDVNVIFYVFPNDCQMKGLPTVCNARKIARILYDIDDFLSRSDWRISDKRLKIEVVRYKPEKRAVVKVASRAVNLADLTKRAFTIYLRTYSDDRGESIYHTMKDLYRSLNSHPEVKVPRALAYVNDKRFLLIEGLDGKSLVAVLHSTEKHGLIIKAAKALAVLHQLKDVKVSARSSKDLMTDARATGETVKQIVPEMAGIVRFILNKLEPLNTSDAGERVGFVHGDFHCGQMLIQDNATAVLDFDCSFFGETLVDVGNFCAHLCILGRQNHWSNSPEVIDCFVTKYESAVHKKLDKERLKLWTAFGLLLFSVYPFRSMEPEWKSSVTDTVRECERILS